MDLSKGDKIYGLCIEEFPDDLFAADLVFQRNLHPDFQVYSNVA
jgi:hypothetical protein